MILYDYIRHERSWNNHVTVTIENGYCDTSQVFDDNIAFLATSPKYKYLMSHKVFTYNSYECDPIIVNIDDHMKFECKIGTDIRLGKSSLFGIIKYKLLHVYDIWSYRLSRYNMLPNLLRLTIDKYYSTFNDTEYSDIRNFPHIAYESVDYPNEGGRVLVYNADTVHRYGYGRFKCPVFRIDVYMRKNEDADKLHRPFNNDELDIDTTAVYTLDPTPRPLRSYDEMKRRLKGNVISECRFNELIEFVRNNYDALLDAWYTHPSQFGTPEYGVDHSRIKPINPNVYYDETIMTFRYR